MVSAVSTGERDSLHNIKLLKTHFLLWRYGGELSWTLSYEVHAGTRAHTRTPAHTPVPRVEPGEMCA